MATNKLKKKAKRGAKRVAKFADELRYKLEQYRLDDHASTLIDQVLRAIEELRQYEQEVADRLADEPEKTDKANKAEKTARAEGP